MCEWVMVEGKGTPMVDIFIPVDIDAFDVLVSGRSSVELEEVVDGLSLSVTLLVLRIAVVPSMEGAGNVDREDVPAVDGSSEVEEEEVTACVVLVSPAEL